MIFGEHLSADEVAVKCTCGISATVEVVDRHRCSRGWFCRRCAEVLRADLKREAKLAKAIVRKNTL